MEQRAFHGKIDAEELARSLVLRFNAGDSRAQWMRGEEGRTVVQIQSLKQDRDDPTTAVTLHISPSRTGIVVALGEQQWAGVAADLAKSGLMAVLNPWSLLGEIDDIARNVQRLQLRQQIWQAIDAYCKSSGVSTGGVMPVQQVICPYCGTPAEVGQPTCKACLGPLGSVQPITCPRCGFLNEHDARQCVNCRTPLSR